MVIDGGKNLLWPGPLNNDSTVKDLITYQCEGTDDLKEFWKTLIKKKLIEDLK